MDSSPAGSLPGGSFRLVTFGCKANQYDSQRIREALTRAGWRERERGEEGPEADLVVINTCTVTSEAGGKARRLARRIARESPGTRLALAGCLARGEEEELAELPGTPLVIAGDGEATPSLLLMELGIDAEPLPGISRFAGHTRAFLKIQDGCDMRCAYCIVPSVRGPSRSRPAEEIVEELGRLLAAGHREIVLVGIHIGHWGRDLGSELGVLLERLARVEARDAAGAPIDWRLRLSSIEATEATGAVLDAMANHPRRIAPHLHLPLQSGDDGVLRTMRRWYRAERFLAACAKIRARLDRPGLTSDVIVGFPGEDETAFANSLETVRHAAFSRVHVFPFSPRPGTEAARPETIGAPVAPPVMRERRDRLAALAKELAAASRRSLAGMREEVILEEGDDPEAREGWIGRYHRVRVPRALLPDPLPDLFEIELALDAERSPADDGEAELIGRPLPNSLPTR